MPSVTYTSSAGTLSTDYTISSAPPTGAPYVPFESKVSGNTVPMNLGTKFSSGSIVTFQPGTFEAVDFPSQYNDAIFSYGIGVYGSGKGQTIFQVRPNTSTAAGRVPADTPTPQGKTNPLYVMRFQNNAPAAQGFTVQGTTQGHNYNGIQLYDLSNWTMRDVAVLGVPGSAGFEPGETFPIAVYRGTNITLDGITIDGQGKTATGIGVNFTGGFTLKNSTLGNTKYGSGISCYHSTGDMNFTNVDFRNNGFYGSNWEDHKGTATYTNCTFGNNPNGDIGIFSTQSVKIRIQDPIVGRTGKVYIRSARTLPDGTTPSAQLNSDINVYVGNTLRNDLLAIGTGYSAT